MAIWTGIGQRQHHSLSSGSAGFPKDFAATGISAERGTIHVLHDELPGLLFAGTHEFHAAPATLATVKLGRRLFGRIERRQNQWWLYDVRLAAP